MNGRQSLDIPTQANSEIIFPWNSRSEKFEREFYVANMTDYKISFEQIDYFLHEVDEIAKGRIQKARLAYFLFLISAFVLLVSVLVLMITSDEGFLTKLACLFAWLVFVVLFSFIISKNIKKKFEGVRIQIQKLQKRSYTVFEERGFRWEFVMHYPGSMILKKDDDLKLENTSHSIESTPNSSTQQRWDKQEENMYQHI